MNSSTLIHDAYGICESYYVKDFVMKFIDAAPSSALACTYDYRIWPHQKKNALPKDHTLNLEKFYKYMTRTTGQLYIKMLAAIEHCGDASYHEVYRMVLKPRGLKFGNDTELFKSLSINGLVELDHIGKYKRKFFRLSALGKIVLDTAKKNDVAYNVLRHFMKMDGCDFDQKMINIQLNVDTLNDVQPESFVSLVKAILDNKSSLYETGSYAYWCNKLVECLKKNKDFFEIFNCEEVKTWLESNKSMKSVQRFIDVMNSISKKHARKVA